MVFAIRAETVGGGHNYLLPDGRWGGIDDARLFSRSEDAERVAGLHEDRDASVEPLPENEPTADEIERACRMLWQRHTAAHDRCALCGQTEGHAAGCVAGRLGWDND